MTGDSLARERIVQQRMKLRERFLREMQQSPAAADPKPQGSGPPNHHGMPKLPVGQTETKKWPVLDLGTQPEISPREHGGPVRMITPQLYAWKGAKWIKRLEILTEDQPGFWEQNGYSNTAHPWRDDRYSR